MLNSLPRSVAHHLLRSLLNGFLMIHVVRKNTRENKWLKMMIHTEQLRSCCPPSCLFQKYRGKLYQNQLSSRSSRYMRQIQVTNLLAQILNLLDFHLVTLPITWEHNLHSSCFRQSILPSSSPASGCTRLLPKSSQPSRGLVLALSNQCSSSSSLQLAWQV